MGDRFSIWSAVGIAAGLAVGSKVMEGIANRVPYLQQLEMESLGKSADLHSNAITVPTGPTV